MELDSTVAGAVNGSRDDLSRLTEAILPHIRGTIVARLAPTPGQMHAVDEIAQQVLMGLTTGIQRLENPTHAGLKAFVSGIVRNQVSLFLSGRGGDSPGPKRASLDSTFAGCSQMGPLWQFLSSDGTSPLSAAVRTDQCGRIVEELGRLKPEHREVITLAFFDQLPTGEIAGILGISRPAASMLLIRAIKSLRRNLTGSSEIGTSSAFGSPPRE